MAAAHPLDQPLDASLQRAQVGEQQLRLDQLHVAHRIDPALDVGDVAALEAAQHVEDRIHLPDRAEKAVAEPFAPTGAAHQPRNVDHLQLGRKEFG